MQMSWKFARAGAVVLALVSSSACAGTGGLGNVLGSVLGGGGQQASQVSGQVAGVDTRNQQIGLRQSNGQVVSVAYDQNTQVVYQNQSYPVTALENGDQVTLRLQQTQNGGYYTDMVQVDQSVRASSSVGYPTQGGVTSYVGTVRSVARQQGFFSLTMQNGAVVTVQLPSQVSRNDLSRFNSLRAGDYVQFYGANLGNNNIELRQFQ